MTNSPIAVDSDDHIHPDGVHLDNNMDYVFVDNVEKHFDKKIKMLDLGCAGGELVCRMHERGHTSVGLEGSDHCLNYNGVGEKPRGYENWQKYGNKILFTCDVTKDFQLLEDGSTVTFNLITCFDVIEHFYEHQLDNFFRNVQKHLDKDGIFVASIALFDLVKSQGVNWHKCVESKEWWDNKTSQYFDPITYPFGITNRGQSLHSDREFVFAGKLK
jgi:2-polyprenyl-3-methyl-5-hydroxy-6-metoxy-1,4-benzoquinol methylase